MTYACRVHTMENNMKGRFINKVRGLYGKVFAFIRTDRTTKERDLCKKPKANTFPVIFVGKHRTITRPGTLVLLFLKAVYL